MSDTVQLFLSGQVLPGFAPGEVAIALARLLKISETQAQAMLAGQETLIKRSLPLAQLAQYQQTLTRLGVGTRVQGQEAPMQPAALAVEPAAAVVKPDSALDSTDAAQVSAQAEARMVSESVPPAKAKQLEQRHWYTDSEPAHTPAAFGWDYTGRLNRLRYMAYGLLAMLPIFALVLLVSLSVSLGAVAAAWVIGLVGGAASVWLLLRVLVLRLHDLGLSGHWLWLLVLLGMLMAVPLPGMKMAVNILISLLSLLLCLWPGRARENEHGAPNGPNHGWIIAGAVLYALLSIATLLAEQPEEAETSSVKAPGRLQAPLQIETSPDPVKQEALVRAAIDKAAKEQGVELDEVAREAAVQAYLRELQP